MHTYGCTSEHETQVRLSCMLSDCHVHVRLFMCLLRVDMPVSFGSDLGNLCLI